MRKSGHKVKEHEIEPGLTPIQPGRSVYAAKQDPVRVGAWVVSRRAARRVLPHAGQRSSGLSKKMPKDLCLLTSYCGCIAAVLGTCLLRSPASRGLLILRECFAHGKRRKKQRKNNPRETYARFGWMTYYDRRPSGSPGSGGR